MIPVLSINLYDKEISSFIESNFTDLENLKNNKNLCISATGVHGIITAQKDYNFKKNIKFLLR